MRFSSSGRSCIALLLSVLLLLQCVFPAVAKASGESPGIEPALLLKYAAPEIPEAFSREILDKIPEKVVKDVRIRWVAVPVEATSVADANTIYPLPDDATLKSISGKISLASRHMEKVENREAAKLLSEAEKEARRCRFSEAVRPFLAEIFLRQGILKLREKDIPSAESLFSRSRALRPGFVPDSALFPPQVIAVWGGISGRPLPEAELLVQSLPSGAAVSVDGVYKGRTPARINPGKTGPVNIRVSSPGYRDAEKAGQWLPGDAETLDFNLSGDRVARLGDLLSKGGEKQGWGAGPLINEFAAAAGVQWVAVVTLEKEDGPGDGYIAKAYSRGKTSGGPVFLGEKRILDYERNSQVTGKWLAGKLLENGWPVEKKDPESEPWYKSWWTWGIVAAVAAGIVVALAGGGGGGSGGSKDSSIAVNF